MGTPLKRGWDVMGEVWDASPKTPTGSWASACFTCGSTAAAVIRNSGTVNGEPTLIESIEIYKFGDDGSLLYIDFLGPLEGQRVRAVDDGDRRGVGTSALTNLADA